MTDKDLLNTLIEDSSNELKLSEKQTKIIQAAIEMFAEKGYAATSTSAIAKKAGVAEGTIFRHYKTKKDLLISIVSPIITKFALPFFAQHFVNEVLEKKYAGFDDLLYTLIKNRFEFVKNNVPMLKIILQEIAFHPEIKEHYTAVFSETILPRFKEVIGYYQEDELIDYPIETIIRLTISPIMGFMVTRFIMMPDADWDDEKEIKHTVDFIMKGLSKI